MDTSNVPQSIVDQATNIATYFANHGVLRWQLGGIESRGFVFKEPKKAQVTAMIEEAKFQGLDEITFDAAVHIYRAAMAATPVAEFAAIAEQAAHDAAPAAEPEPSSQWPIKPLEQVQVFLPDGVTQAMCRPAYAVFDAHAMQELEGRTAMPGAGGEVEKLKAEIDDLTGQLEDLAEEQAVWPAWAEQIIKIVRDCSGYDGYDDSDGVDLPGEVQELADEYSRVCNALEELRKASPPAASTGEPLAQPLTVWFGSIPESNGRENWTVTLRRKPESVTTDNKHDRHRLLDGVTVFRSEYKDRMRYHADELRFLLGEIAERPDILAYDADLRSDYKEPLARELSDEERELFEQAAVDIPTIASEENCFVRDRLNGDYVYASVRAAWEAWQAARSLPPSPAGAGELPSLCDKLRNLANGVRLGHCPDKELLAERMESIARAAIASASQEQAEPAASSEHYDEIKATLKGAHAIMEGVSALERKVGPLGSHARGYTHKITKALRHLDALAAKPLEHLEQGEVVGIVQALNVCGEPMPNSSGVEWLRPVPLGAKLYLATPPQPRSEPTPAVPEGCTPADARVLREGNHQLASDNERLRSVLRFYAAGQHFNLSDESAWDTVSGEPQNFWCDEAGTATVEDGCLAAMALRGEVIDWEDDEPPVCKGEPEYAILNSLLQGASK